MLNKTRKLRISNSLIGLLVVLNLVLGNFSQLVRAEETKETNSNYGIPTHRRDGGSRGSSDDCIINNRDLAALIPKNVVASTVSASPKLFFYVPEISKEKTIEFVLRDQQDQLMYEAFVTTRGKGIITLEIPADVKTNLLKAEHNYHWYLSIICDSQQRSRDVVVEGLMHQTVLDSATKKELNSSNTVEKATLYQEKGFWYDALSVLAENLNTPKEQAMVTAKWSELLESVGLGELDSEPFVDSKLIKN
jgi:Domain of Unknown Function (DUF928)